MQPVPAATLMTGVGLEGDKHAAAASSRQVLLADKEALDAVGVIPGTIKENLTVEGLHVMQMAVGTRLRLGTSAVLEITASGPGRIDPRGRLHHRRRSRTARFIA